MNKHGQYVHKSEQKATVCIRDGRISYETDESALKEAEENLQSALEDIEKYNLEQEISDIEDAMSDLEDTYQEMLDFLDDQIEKWEKISEFAQNTADAELATQYLGEDWVVKVITGDDDELWSNMKDLYVQNAEQIAQYDKQITTTENINSLLTEYITAYEEESLSYEETLAAIESLLDQMNSDMTTGENLQNVLDYMALMHDTEATVSDVLVGLQTSLDEYSEELIKGIEQNYANGEAIADVRTSWNVMLDNVSDIRDYAEEILEAIEDLDFSNYYRSSSSDDDDDGDTISVTSGTNSTATVVHAERGDVVISGSASAAGYSPADAYAEGLEKGTVNDSDKTTADAIMTLGTTNLESDAVPIIAHKGELVMNPEQQSQLLKNITTLSNPLSSLSSAPILAPLANGTSTVDITIGDIILPDVTDPDGFARAMSTQIQSAMRTAIGEIHL